MRRRNPVTILAALVVFAFALPGCSRLQSLKMSLKGDPPVPGHSSSADRAEQVIPWAPASQLEEVATSNERWTGVAVSGSGRIFVCFPRWAEDVTTSVGELRMGAAVAPYPDGEWNTWTVSSDPEKHFVCAQTVRMDGNGDLWVLDAGSPNLQGVMKGAAKLIKIDPDRNTVSQVIVFDEAAAPDRSYLNDVRIDVANNTAYVTDSGLGAIIVVDLGQGTARRVLADNGTTKSEGTVIAVNGTDWEMDGSRPSVNVDGIALGPPAGSGDAYLYYQALTGTHLYRIKTSYLRDSALTDKDLSAKVESLGVVGPTDGMEFGPDGYLFMTGVEDGSIKVFAALNKTETVIRDPRLSWPDTFASAGNYMYVTTSQLNLGREGKGRYGLYRFKIR
jgi:hypothetical protein